MPQMTLLEMVQDIASSMSSDEVNSIGDTTESLQIASIIRRKYYDIVSRASLPEDDELLQFTPSNDSTKPVLMYLPESCSKVTWIKYFDTNPTDGADQTNDNDHDINVDIPDSVPGSSPIPPGYQYVTILPLEQFLDMVNGFNPSENNVLSYQFEDGSNSFTLYYKNDHQPRYCTIISNNYVLFDMFDATQDDTLQANKIMAYGQVMAKFKLEDSFIPDIDDTQFPLLVNEAKALAFFELKQQQHPLADVEIKRGWSSIQKNKSVVNRPTYFDQLPSFGRIPNTGGYGGRALPRLRNT